MARSVALGDGGNSRQGDKKGFCQARTNEPPLTTGGRKKDEGKNRGTLWRSSLINCQATLVDVLLVSLRVCVFFFSLSLFFESFGARHFLLPADTGNKSLGPPPSRLPRKLQRALLIYLNAPHALPPAFGAVLGLCFPGLT